MKDEWKDVSNVFFILKIPKFAWHKNISNDCTRSPPSQCRSL